jgi:hypothetical protein
MFESSPIRDRSFWAKHSDLWKESGLSQKEYCKKEGLKSTTFSYWRRVFKSNDEVLKTTFQEVKLKEEKSDNVSPLLQVKLPNGVMIA